MQVADFLASLDEAMERELVASLTVGVLDAQLAAQCIVNPGHQREKTATQLLAYLEWSIKYLERARRIIQERLEGGENTSLGE